MVRKTDTDAGKEPSDTGTTPTINVTLEADQLGVPNGANVGPLIAFLKEHLQPRPELLLGPKRDGDSVRQTAEVMSVPEGFKLESIKKYLDEYRDRPERREGVARLQDLDSFIAHAVRFKDDHSALFAFRSEEKPSLTAVLDYHEKDHTGKPRFGKHRSFYEFPLSKEWRAWKVKDGAENAMTQGEFAAFLEDRIVDVIGPPDWQSQLSEADKRLRELVDQFGTAFAGPAKLLELARGLQVNANSVVKNAQSLTSGEAQIAYSEEHTDGSGKPLKVPGAFLISIPVFEAGAPYRIPVRLRYRIAGPKIVWFYQIYRPDLSLEHAFREAIDKAKDETGLPLFLGTPE